MCDYSLEYVVSRPAKVGERLVSTVFRSSITRGFASPENAEVAVCLLPGTELVFDEGIKTEHPLGFFPINNLKEKTARFCRVNPEVAHAHHDALELPSGKIVPVTRLVPNQYVTVIQMPVMASGEKPEGDETPVETPAPAEAPAAPAEIPLESVLAD